MHNLATIAAEQKPLTVLPNGSTHLQSLQHKDGSVIPQQIIVKSDSNHSVVKRELNLSPLIKSDISMSNSVIQGLPQNMRQPTPILAGPQQIMKGIPTGNNPALVTLRTHTPNSQQHVVVRASVATTLANSSPSVQVVNASAAGTPTIRPAVTQQIRPGQVRITNPVRIGTQPNIAPRQQNAQANTLTIPHGALLMRNESGQLVLVSASQTVLQQTPSSNSVITTMAPSGYRIPNVRPLTSQAPVRTASGGQTIVTIQPQATPQQQSIQVRGPTIATVVPTSTLQRPAGQTSNIIGQPTTTVGQTNITTFAATGEMNQAMLENVKKCKNFLSTLIKLAYSQPPETVKNVKALIQGLIDGKVEPEMFTERLQHELQSSPQPYLVPFLKKSLPLLRQSMLKGRMVIDGVKPPPAEVAGQSQSITVSQSPATTIVSQQVITASGTLTQRPVVAPRPTMAPLQQQQIRSSLGPASSKVAPIRQTMPQVAIAPGGNKVVLQASQIRQQMPNQVLNQVRPKMTVARPSSQFIRATNKPITTAVVKAEPSSPAAGHREKRKFESLKDGDDDINDVATMGGVNLSEESKNILATTNADFIGAQMRSCKDEIFLAASPLHKKISTIAKKYGIEDISPAVVNIVSHATQERLRDMVSKLSTIAEHRVEIYKMDSRYEVESETKLKLKFLEELDKLEKKRHEEQEREKLLRAIKSRSKNEDPEQLKLKQKAKELQQAEAEELRQREANLTALAAIGPRKKRRLDFADATKSGSSTNNNSFNSNSSLASVIRPRTKRVNLRDVQFLLESERSTRKSELLYKTFLK
ncbi:transcription initiation factor TFIID subunit 4-like isoform X3 [Physella acuta]|nr:transcription initiation factor TFIID subunit 4-like isoform X3 [Physella acuta]